MNEVTVFNFNDQGQVRTVVKDGEPWFIVKDICDILELTNPTVTIESLDDDERSKYFLGRQGEVNIVNESGLYTLVFKSRKPEAKAFRKWVTSEVLPTIRKTGHYTVTAMNMISEEFTSRAFAALRSIAVTAGLEGNAATVSADNAMKRIHNISPLNLLQIELKTPDQQRLLTPTQIAERLKLSGPREVNLILAAKGFQTREGKRWLPTDTGKPFAVLLDTGKQHSSGVMVQQLKWKESILSEFENLIN